VIPLVVVTIFLVIVAAVLALAEASISRMTIMRAVSLRKQGRRNAALLERIESDPARYLNSVYLCVMGAQNGSAILVAILAEHYLGDVGITVVSVGFTLIYFVIVEAMCKTFAILHSDRVALFLAPFVWLLGRSLAIPTRALIGLGNVLLPGKGLPQGPFIVEHEIRSLADVGHKEGGIETHEKEMIHSVFEFGDLIVRNVMVPWPDIVALDLGSPLDAAADLIVASGFTRIPVYRGDLDHTEGIVHAQDVLNLLRQSRHEVPLADLMRSIHFVPEFKHLVELLHEMQQERFHLAMVTDEYGSLVGLVTLEDLLEELVGKFNDEHDRGEADIVPLDNGRYRVNATLPILELNDALGANLPHDKWNTVGGLVFGLAGAIPAEGAVVECDAFRFTVERIQGRRIVTALVEPLAAPSAEPGEAGRSISEPAR
jgi:CBS domain containing-hemolysin-like protein